MRTSNKALLVGVVLCLGADCNDINLNRIFTIDTFQQERRNAVDLLVIVDNSCSMVEEQDSLSTNFDALIRTFTDAEVDWRIGVTTTDVESDRYKGLLLGGDDEIIVRGPNGELDRIEYNRTWGFENGQSMALGAENFAVTSNDSPLNWCAPEASYSDGHRGTPGERNGACSGTPMTFEGNGVDDGPRTPLAGDLIISEVLSQSSQTGDAVDSRCEWVELTNLSDTLSLDGIVIADLGRNSIDRPEYDTVFGPAAIPAGRTVAPGDVVVLGRAMSNNCGAPVDVAFDTNFTLNDDVRWITPETPDAPEVFAEQVAQGTIGAGIEMGLEAGRLVFEEPYWTESNQGFLRDDAGFAVLIVSDEDDRSPFPVDGYLRYFAELKGDAGYRDPSAFSLSAVVGKEQPPRADLPSCQSDNGSGYYGRRYLEAATVTGGLTESICADDFAPIITQLGLTISGLRLEFELSRVPNDISELTVELYSGENELESELERDADYTYNAQRNSIVFEEDQVPPSQWFVVARYFPSTTNDPIVETSE
jgi:hypothetical protein